ncbi:MAG: hypothetical protein CO167_08835, partial [Candidatus Marinimicrobia bacterium CG_4_9_14_3_um_filter_48_9]
GTYEIIGDSTTISALSPIVIPVSATDFQALSDYADGADIEVRAVLSDLSYTTFGTASASIIHIDVTAPIDSEVGAVVAQTGTVVNNFWNGTNQSLRVTVPFTASDLSMLGGNIQLQARINNLPYVNTGTPVTVETPTSPVNILLGRADIEGLVGFGSGVDLYVGAQLTDNAGNLTLYEASQTVVRIDTTQPTDPVIGVTPMGENPVAGRWNMLTDSAVVHVPLENDSTLLHLDGQVATVGITSVQMRVGTNAWTNVGTAALITALNDSAHVTVARNEIVGLTGYQDGAWIFSRARIVDQAGNADTSLVSDDSLQIDISPPAAFQVESVITAGGSVVENYWNASNSGVEVSVPIANDASLMTGTLEIQVYVGDTWAFVEGEGIAATETIEQINTTQVVQIDSSVIEHLAGFDELTILWFNAIITDRNGNRTLSSPVTHYLEVDQIAPDTAAIGLVYDPD